MTFVREDSHYRCYYDEFNVLLGTGMRVSEFCGLTLSDLDFENRKIRVEKQLIKEKGGVYHVEKTKTASGVRFIPMSDEVYQSLRNIVANRKPPQKELMVNGFTGFLLHGPLHVVIQMQSNLGISVLIQHRFHNHVAVFVFFVYGNIVTLFIQLIIANFKSNRTVYDLSRRPLQKTHD